MKYIFFLVCSFFFSNFCLSSSTFCPEASKNIGEEIFREKEEIYLGFLALAAGRDSENFNWDAQATDLGTEKTYRELVKNSIGEDYSSELSHWRFTDTTTGRLFLSRLIQRPSEDELSALVRFAKENDVDIKKTDSFIVNKLREDYKFRKAIYDAGERIKWRKRYEANKPTPEALREDFLRRKKAEEHKEVMNIFKTAGVWAAYGCGILLICRLLYVLGRSMRRGWSFSRWACLVVVVNLGMAVFAGFRHCLAIDFTLPYGFFDFLRLAVSALSVWLVYTGWKRKAHPLLVILPALLVLLYQPIFKVPLSAGAWLYVDLAAMPTLIFLAALEPEEQHPKEDEPHHS